MKTFTASSTIKGTRLIELFMLAIILTSPVHAQVEASLDDAERAQRQAQREEMMANNPQLAERMEERREQRETMMANNPEAAARMQERRERMQANPELRGNARPQRRQDGEQRPRRPPASE